MKIVIIHGQNHAGSTCMVARELARKVGGEIREFFLPRDFDAPCLGCYTCFQTDLTHCPHYQKLEPLVTAILEADLLIVDSPVYAPGHAEGRQLVPTDPGNLPDEAFLFGCQHRKCLDPCDCDNRCYASLHRTGHSLFQMGVKENLV